MKKFLFGWICLAWLMGSCASATPAHPADAVQGKPTVAAVMDSSPTPSPLPTAHPTETSIPATRTVTPLPTIPTFTPTFDARTVVTVTPAPPSGVPENQSRLNSQFQNSYKKRQYIYRHRQGNIGFSKQRRNFTICSYQT